MSPRLRLLYGRAEFTPPSRAVLAPAGRAVGGLAAAFFLLKVKGKHTLTHGRNDREKEIEEEKIGDTRRERYIKKERGRAKDDKSEIDIEEETVQRSRKRKR